MPIKFLPFIHPNQTKYNRNNSNILYSNENQITIKELITGKCGENSNYEFDGNTLKISGYGIIYNYTGSLSNDLPWMKYKSNIKTLIVGEGITTIGINNFCNCKNLVTVSLPSTLTTICDEAFTNCISLESIDFPDSVTFIEFAAFMNCTKLKSIVLPKNLKRIPENAFMDCDSILNVVIPNGVTRIETRAFANCAFKKITIPDSVTSLSGFEVFKNNRKLLSVNFQGNLNYIGWGSFAYCTSLKFFKFPDIVASIGSGMFTYCINLQTVIFPSNVQKIDNYMFSLCSSLTSVVYNGINFVDSIILSSKNEDFSLVKAYVPLNYDGETFIGLPVVKVEIDSLNFTNDYEEYESSLISEEITTNENEVSTSDFSCEDIIQNCLECNDEEKCIKCKPGFILIDSQCQEEMQIQCNSTFTNCKQCKGTKDNHHCVECNKNYALEGGKCVTCEKGQFFNEKQACLTNCNNITHCNYCGEISDVYYCTQCEDGFELSHDQKLCNYKIDHIMPNPPMKVEIQISDSKYVELDESNNKIIVLTDNLEPIDETKEIIYELTIPSNIIEVSVPQTDKNIQLVISNQHGESNDERVKINTNQSGNQVIVDCPNGAYIVVNSVNNLNPKGNGEIKIESENKSSVILITKITLDKANTNPPLFLNSDYSNLSYDEIQVFGQQEFIGQKEPKQSSCKTLKLESGSLFTPKYISVETAKVGFASILNITNENVKIKHFIAYYNMSQNLYNKIPIMFYMPYPDLNDSDIMIDKISQGELFQEEIESFIVAQFNGENDYENKMICEKLMFIKSYNFVQAECIKVDDHVYNLVAKQITNKDIRNNGKKKLSVGAIVGIVIGGIVLVALIVIIAVFSAKKRVSNY